MDYLLALILGIVEGVTEFLPISSTGHLIVATALLGFPTANLQVPDPKAFRETFEIFIQVGAIIAVIAFYGRDLLSQLRKIPTDRTTQSFWLSILIASVPAALVGFLLRHWITDTLYKPVVVGVALIVGGIVFLLLETRPLVVRVNALEKITLPQAVLIGLAQMTALIPGVSRSGASIVGGLLIGLDRPTATVLSFYMAIPILIGATFYQLFSAIADGLVRAADLPLFAVGTVVSFVVAWLSIRWLLNYVARHNFRLFGYYRILAGLVIIVLAQFTNLLGN